MSDNPGQLYRHYDAQGVLLYVGISLDTLHRLGEHRKRAPWYRSIARVTIQQCASWRAAQIAEREAIVAERPRHNIVHTLPTHAPRIAELEGLRERDSVLIAAHERTIEDLRRRLDTESQERRQAQTQLAALLTDQRPRKRWWRRGS
jgi:hypothetical protein